MRHRHALLVGVVRPAGQSLQAVGQQVLREGAWGGRGPVTQYILL